MGQHLPFNFETPLAPLPMLRADEGNLAAAVDAAWDMLKRSNREPWLYRLVGNFACVVTDDEGRPISRVVDAEKLRYMLSRIADWRRMTRDGLAEAAPPMRVVHNILATPNPDLPVMGGIVSAPVFGRSGKLLTGPGYHPDAQLLYAPSRGFEVPRIPEKPTLEQIVRARQLLCEDLLGGFSFVSQAERAHAVAMLLLGFGRSLITGPTPLHMIEKPTPGSGATLLADVAATLLTGVGAGVMTEAKSDEEWRKRLTAKLRESPSLVVLDNLTRRLDSQALASVLTAPHWEDRILCASQNARLTVRCVWIATANNPQVSREIARRLVRIRLDPNVERPWMRSEFRHPDLIAYVHANRPSLVAACLTLWQAWIAQGRPIGERIHGSFEDWSRVMGGVLAVAGIDGFLGNREDVMDASDEEGAGWDNFIAEWWRRFGPRTIAVKELFGLALECDPGPEISGSNDRAMQTSLGMGIRRMKDRMFGVDGCRLRLAKAGVLHGATLWKLEICEPLATSRMGEPFVQEGTSKTQAPSLLQGPDKHGRGTWEPGEPLAILPTKRSTRDFYRRV